MKNIWKKAGIWKKAFSISFAAHIVAVITFGAMLAGFHENVQKPQEKIINVDLANADEAEREEVLPTKSFSPIRALQEAIQENMDVSEAAQQVVDPTLTPEDEAKSEDKQQEEPKAEEKAKAGADSKPAQGESNSATSTAADGVLPSGGNSDKGNGGGGNGNAEGNSKGNSEGSSRGTSHTGGGNSSSTGGGSSNKSGGGQAQAAGESVGSLAARFAAAVNANKQYPYAAIRLGQTGVVEVSVTLDASGNCLGASVVSGASGNLNKAAINAVYASTPFPHKVGRTVTLTVPVHFNLN